MERGSGGTGLSHESMKKEQGGKIRALQQRAAHVIKQNNDFIAKVSTSHSVPYERNAPPTAYWICFLIWQSAAYSPFPGPIVSGFEDINQGIPY